MHVYPFVELSVYLLYIHIYIYIYTYIYTHTDIYASVGAVRSTSCMPNLVLSERVLIIDTHISVKDHVSNMSNTPSDLML